METWEHLLRIGAELLIIAWGLYITYRNRDKGKLLSKAEETIKRQRIEIVIQEERIEELQQDNRIKEDELNLHRDRTKSQRLRHQRRIDEIKGLLGSETPSEAILEAFKDKGDASESAGRLTDLIGG